MKTLLIAPKLPQAFWTLDQTLLMEKKKALSPPLGLITVAALLPRHWQLRLVDRSISEIPGDLWEWCDLVMLSCMFPQKEDTLALIKECKTKGKRVAVGGPYPTVLPREVIEAGADFVFLGEGEETVPRFLASLANGESSGVFEEDKKPDLATSPIPRYELLDMSAYCVMSLQTTRGCPFQCEFCDVIKLNGRRPRHKSPEQIIGEAEALYAHGWKGDVFIADDNMIGSRPHALKILKQLARWNKGRGEPFGFWAQASINLGQDLELIDHMTDGNFGFVFIGVESPDREALVCSRKYHNAEISLDNAVQTINRNGLSIVASFMIGLDGETKGVGERICDFVERNHLPVVMINPLHATPRTALWDRLERENRLLPNVDPAHHFAGMLNYVPTRPATEVRGEYFRVLERLYEPRGYLQRAYDYYLNMRPTRRALGIEEGSSTDGYRKLRGQPRKDVRKDLFALGHLVWRQGVRAPYRLLFWRQLFGMMKKNPSRVVGYLRACGFGENLFPLRNVLCEKPTSP
jgi:radical SAM superfamily enzyme YgiQ (UPF0313 family)